VLYADLRFMLKADTNSEGDLRLMLKADANSKKCFCGYLIQTLDSTHAGEGVAIGLVTSYLELHQPRHSWHHTSIQHVIIITVRRG